MAAALPPVFLHGRALVSALGPSLDDAVQACRAASTHPDALPAMQRRPAGDFPVAHRPLNDGRPEPTTAEAWWQRALDAIQACVARTQAPREGALWIASSSFDIGALELGGEWASDGLAVAEKIAAHIGWRGPVHTVSTACTSSVNALRQAQTQLQLGRVEDALVLGLELGNRYARAGFAALQLLPPWPVSEAHAPTGGLVLGETVAALALSRRPGRWRLVAGAHCVSGADPAGPTAEALVQAIQSVLKRGSVPAERIGLVKSHAAPDLSSVASMPAAWAVEHAVLSRLLPHDPRRMPLQGLLGHTQGASSTAELALLTAWIDTLRTRNPGPVPVPGTPGLSADRPCLLALSLGFGGGHGALLLEDTHVRA